MCSLKLIFARLSLPCNRPNDELECRRFAGCTQVEIDETAAADGHQVGLGFSRPDGKQQHPRAVFICPASRQADDLAHRNVAMAYRKSALQVRAHVTEADNARIEVPFPGFRSAPDRRHIVRRERGRIEDLAEIFGRRDIT